MTALQQENAKAGGGGRKIGREESSAEEDGDANDIRSEKVRALDENREMNVKQLGEEAKFPGLSVACTENEPIERLSQEYTSSPGDPPPVGRGDEEEEEEERIVTFTKKGAGVLDQHIPDYVKSQYHVLQLDKDKASRGLTVQLPVQSEKIVFEKPSEKLRLEPGVAEFISLLYNANMVKQQVMASDPSIKHMQRNDVLKRISDVIGTSNRSKLEEDLLYSTYSHLHCELTPVDRNSENFAMIASYVQNTHGKSHSDCTVEIVQIFSASRKGEAERFGKFSSTHNRMLLWHGSHLTNWTGILSQGLRIPQEVLATRRLMFGKGVYFADMFSKSAKHCYASSSAVGVLLLCEVALGDMQELSDAKYDADRLPEGKLSTKGVGKTAPDLTYAQVLEDGVIVPLGKAKEQPTCQGALSYNEYVVYNEDQIRMRYVVQINFQ